MGHVGLRFTAKCSLVDVEATASTARAQLSERDLLGNRRRGHGGQATAPMHGDKITWTVAGSQLASSQIDWVGCLRRNRHSEGGIES